MEIKVDQSRTTIKRTSGAAEPLRVASSNTEIDRAAERIELWLLEWLVARLGLELSDVSRDRPFAEFGVDSLTAVELSHELETEFKVPLPPIVAWNYPTPAALSRYLAEQSLNSSAAEPAESSTQKYAHDPNVSTYANGHAAVNGQANGVDPTAADDRHLAALLAEIENLSDEEAARLLADEAR
jgi:acyl carrier protein